MSHEIVTKKVLNDEDYFLEIDAPLVAQNFKAGQFVIIRIDKRSERVPLTISDANPEKGTISLIIKAVGKSTHSLRELEVGGEILDVVGPLGNPSEIENFGTVICVGGGTGIACLFPIIKALKAAGNQIISIIGGRTKDRIIWEDEIRESSDDLIVTTDDGSYGRKGVVTEPLEELLKEKTIDRVIAIGPPIMMKFVAKTTKPHGIKTIVSLNTIMVDGTGMCGACRVFIKDEMKFACIDGPEFDGHDVNFDEVMRRLNMFRDKESDAMKCLNCKEVS
jgi:NAD(P)H-flavin reductase